MKNTIIIGAGPAGLTAAHVLAASGVPVTVLEADPEYVGGISRTASYKGFRFDIGGHRFFSKSAEVEQFWSDLLGKDMLDRPRSSRIFYGGKFFSYPLKAAEALFNLGLWESTLCVWSYAMARLFPVPNPRSFEDWVSNQFGKRLFRIFFKTYTEKVWGMSCSEISADWAAQRIKGLSLGTVVRNALLPRRQPKDKSQIIKTLIETFRYPRLGPGMMWDACAAQVRQMGGQVLQGYMVESCRFDRAAQRWYVQTRKADGSVEEFEGGHVISSTAITHLIAGLTPQAPAAVTQAAKSLRYRDFLTVALILKEGDRFSDNWIYIHDPAVKVGRIQNYKSWSPEMIPDPQFSCYGLEYFCFEGDGLWTMSDAELVALATRELAQIGLAAPEDVVDGCVVRQPKAYPVYDDHYATHVNTIRQELDQNYPGLHLVGRNGMHKYNNQDHAMMTAMLTAKNIISGSTLFDVWSVNQDAGYHEEGTAGAEKALESLRSVPSRLPEKAEK